ALGSMIGWPLYRLIKNIRKRGRLPDMKSTRVTVSAACVAVVLLLFFFLPVPVTRIRQTGLVEVQEPVLRQVHVLVPGRLERLRVKEGEHVSKGKIIAEFSNQELELRIAEAIANIETKKKVVDIYDARLAQSRDSNEKIRLDKEILDAKGELLKAQ